MFGIFFLDINIEYNLEMRITSYEFHFSGKNLEANLFDKDSCGAGMIDSWFSWDLFLVQYHL